MNDYCPLCDGDPRRRANVEPHKQHTPELYPVVQVQPDKLETAQPNNLDWLEE